MDVYQPWCGPAKQFETIFKKVKVDLSDPLLFFAIVNKLFSFVKITNSFLLTEQGLLIIKNIIFMFFLIHEIIG